MLAESREISLVAGLYGGNFGAFFPRWLLFIDAETVFIMPYFGLNYRIIFPYYDFFSSLLYRMIDGRRFFLFTYPFTKIFLIILTAKPAGDFWREFQTLKFKIYINKSFFSLSIVWNYIVIPFDIFPCKLSRCLLHDNYPVFVIILSILSVFCA